MKGFNIKKMMKNRKIKKINLKFSCKRRNWWIMKLKKSPWLRREKK